MIDDMKAAALAMPPSASKMWRFSAEEVLALIARCEAAEGVAGRMAREQTGDRAIALAHARVLEEQVAALIAERDRLRAALQQMVTDFGDNDHECMEAQEVIDEARAALAAKPAEPAEEGGDER